MSQVVHRDLRHLPVMVDRGEGIYLFDSEGNKYLDASGGAAVSCLGYGHPAMLNAIQEQLSKVAYVHTGFFTSEPAEQLAVKLAGLAPGDLNYSYFSTSGSEAVEVGLKMARQYAVDTGRPERKYFISRTHSFHGSTLSTLSIGRQVMRREPFLPLFRRGINIPPYYPYRFKLEHESDDEYSIRMADALEQKILEVGAEKVAAFVAETVGGATAGVLPSSKLYLQRIREICDRYEIILIFDEVMCGSGRCGTFFAAEQYGVQADVTTIAKGLGAGIMPIAATLCTDKLYDTFRDKLGHLEHGGTYSGHSLACAVSCAVIDVLEEENLLANVRLRGKELIENFQQDMGDHPIVGDIRGAGLFIGIEFVADKSTKEPLDPALKFSEKLQNNMMRNKLLCYPGAGTVDGKIGNHVLVAPPYTIDSEYVAELSKRLASTIDETWQQIR